MDVINKISSYNIYNIFQVFWYTLNMLYLFINDICMEKMFNNETTYSNVEF
jgi:hypothetical protein